MDLDGGFQHQLKYLHNVKELEIDEVSWNDMNHKNMGHLMVLYVQHQRIFLFCFYIATFMVVRSAFIEAN